MEIAKRSVIAALAFLSLECTPAGFDEVEGACGSARVPLTPPDDGARATLPVTVSIAQVQGRGHRSSFEGRSVQVEGVVTVLRSDGFYLQSETPDSDLATSEAIFVVTPDGPPVLSGNRVSVRGRVAETRPGCADCGPEAAAFDYLTATELAAGSTIAVESARVPLPEPVALGVAGRRPPAERIDGNAAAGDIEAAPPDDFDVCGDAIDFYESLEHMLVRVDEARAVGPTTPSGEIAIVSDGGRFATHLTERGGVLVRPGDSNPERILVDDLLVLDAPSVNVGARFAEPIVGVIGYSLGNFKLFNSVPLIVEGAHDLVPEQLEWGDAAMNELDVATFNVENLSLLDAEERFEGLAELVVRVLNAPDVLVLQEVQDDSGAVDDGVVTATATLSALARSIEAVGGPLYEFAEIAPLDGADGGQPGGNIRVALMVSSRRGATLVKRGTATATMANQIIVDDARAQLRFSPGRLDPTNAAFRNSRKPLAAEVSFRGTPLVVIANHFVSKGADEPLFGRWQPPALISEAKRQAQAQVVADFVGALLAQDPALAVVVAGDFNDFEFSRPLASLETVGLTNALTGVPESERYTYVFAGNSQALDHVLLSPGASQRGFEYGIVHVNSEFYAGLSDHDPCVVRLRFE